MAAHHLQVWAAIVIGIASVLGVSGCTGVVAQAPFRLRPDTTHWGSLSGPFDGHVFDQGTTNPISGAMVIGTWAFESEAGPAVPVASYSVNVLTGSDGGYSIPALPVSQQRSALLRRFTLVIYKAGYVGYRSDQRFDDRMPRSDFAQLANVARLERISTGESRAHHLVFLGGGQPLLRAAQAEVIQAALDLAERAPSLPGSDLQPPGKSESETAAAKSAPKTPSTLAEQLLLLADVEAAVRGGKREYSIEALPLNLPGEAPPGDYSGVHYRAKGDKESFDAALRVFRSSSGSNAESIWKRLRAQLQLPGLRDAAGSGITLTMPAERSAQPLLPDVPDKAPPLRDAAGAAHVLLPHVPPPPTDGAVKSAPLRIDASLTAYDAKQRVYGVALFIRRLGLVLELLCGADLCPSEEAAHGLLSRALARL
jgi:hypothetical protein